MRPAPSPPSPPAQGGFALIEVVVSALIAVMVTGAVISLLNSTGRAGASERERSQAFSVAQEDQVRLRSTRVAELATAIAPRTVTLNNNIFEVNSSATFVSDQTGSTSCGSGAQADYVRLGSEVTWTGMGSTKPVVIESIVSPVSGSLDPTNGTLSVTAVNAANVPISGVGLTGTGPGSFSGATDSAGCALFGGQPAGKYEVTPTLGPEYVDVDGNEPESKTISIAAGSTAVLPFLFDKAGTAQVGFTVRNSSGTIENSFADAVTATANGMLEGARIFGTPGGTQIRPIEATPLFPFTYSYNFYAGSCANNKPEAGSANVIVPSGPPAVAATVQLPALYLTVKNSAGTALSGARVTVTDTKCSVGSTPVKRTYTTNSSGNLPNPGVSSSTYDICASASISSTVRRAYAKGIAIKSLNGTTVPISILSSSEAGACP